jgi:tripeptide aminopeptidase
VTSRRVAFPLAVVAAIWAAGGTAAAQAGAGTIGTRLVADAAVTRALDLVTALEPWVLEQQVALCEVPAPPFGEQRRAEVYRKALADLGLQQVRIDAEGNVIGVRPGRAARPNAVISAHLDTVFPEATDVTVTRTGTRLRGPGIGDDCRGLAVMLGVVRALQDSRLETPGTITFVATVGEEGLGDLRGVKHLFAKELPGGIDRFVSIDGTGLGVVAGGVGSLRYRVTFSGPGGHSYGAFGMPNPVHAMGRAIAAVSDLQVPARPKTTFNVGRVGGGTSVNAIAFESWMEVDLRSESPDALADLDQRFTQAMEAAVVAENARWASQVSVKVEVAMVGNRPAGRTADTSPIVQAVRSVGEALGLSTSLGMSSTDANTPMSLGIPAITIGGGGRGTGAHSLEEEFDTTGSADGTRRALLLAVALAQP